MRAFSNPSAFAGHLKRRERHLVPESRKTGHTGKVRDPLVEDERMNKNLVIGASALVVTLILGTGAALAQGKPSRAVDCSLIEPTPNPENPACEIYGGVWTDLDTQLSELCNATDEPAAFKNDSDRVTLISKTIDAAIKVDQGKVSDAATKIEQYELKLGDLLSGDIDDRKTKAKITEAKKLELLYELADVKDCFDDAFN
jgi:hypothetical protein